ncbi:hypothetical protein [Cellulomonas sp. WB94]|uniref:hypothetical protein n=1 Tax=Cellulomonas sp. WB94 TaxID=2173174 RepID=UPI001304CE78|nr:hypothetical protein [Cellulomonas sp. WB94]
MDSTFARHPVHDGHSSDGVRRQGVPLLVCFGSLLDQHAELDVHLEPGLEQRRCADACARVGKLGASERQAVGGIERVEYCVCDLEVGHVVDDRAGV